MRIRRLRSRTIRTSILALTFFSAVNLFAQSKPVDTVVFVNGEQLTGELERANSDGITFKSPMAGEITVKWANIKDLKSTKSFAIITKKEKLTRRDAVAMVPQGAVVADTKDVTIGGKQIPIADTSLIVPAADFDKAIHHQPDLFHGWGGVASAGATLVRATQDSTTFTGAIALTRATPTVDWLPPHDRTSIAYNQTYGTTSQSGTPTVKTNIFHANAERDEYFSSRLFAFGSATYDHNFSQGLNLQQAYGGGIGFTVLKSAKTELDFKGDMQYQQESFSPTAPATPSVSLVGSTFSETYIRHLPHNITFNEFGSYTPSYNITADYSAHVNGTLVFPVYKGFGFNVSAVDDYLNNAPVGSNQNSSQFSTGLTYTIKPR